jgi:endonuclease IV
MTDRELMQQALEALDSDNPDIQLRTAIVLREKLAQPERQWVGLTKAEAKEISMAHRPYVIDMIAALEARLKEKNT